MSTLKRSKDQKIAGVCAGVAKHWEIDVAKFRIAVGVLGLLGIFSAGISTGLMIAIYLLMWWLLPLEE